ncbi:serine protease 33-like [Oppia nitens]|uniref:serine protease 33-like n=1 Tax=Oppia nitens TaxID=1686743 RepID=UPI0023DB0898|nr:serine protease 33-like [Oppia nitens]
MIIKFLVTIVLMVALVAYQCNCNDWWPPSGKTTQAPVVLACGQGLVAIDGEFNGSRSVQLGEVPWQVSVQSKAGGAKWGHSCGGVVISKDFVLTSAVCAGGGSNNEAFCRSEAGIVDLPKGGWARRRRRQADVLYPGQDTPGLKYTMRSYIHPDFDKETLANNLALLQLAQPFDVAKAAGTINHICLATETAAPDADQQLYVSGWGAIDGAIDFRPQLQLVKARQVDCEPIAAPAAELPNQLCVVQDLLDDTMDECVGDFGGPLFSTNGGNQSTLVGIYTSGNGCTSANNTSKFLDIKPYLVWIQETAKPAYG